MVELAPLRPARPVPKPRGALRLVKITDLGRLHQLLLAVVALEVVDLALNLWRLGN